MSAEFRPRYRDALRNRDLRLLLGAFAVSQVGRWAYTVVLVVYVFDRTHSPTWLAATTAALWLPRMLLSSYAGSLTGGRERTRLLTRSAAVSGGVAAALTVLMAAHGPALVALLLAAALASIAAVTQAAAGALTPEVVGEKGLAGATSLFGALENLVVVVGPAIGALVLVIASPAWGAGLYAATLFATAILTSLLTVRSRGPLRPARPSILASARSGLGALRGETGAWPLLAFGALGTAVFGCSTVLFVPMSRHFGTGANGYGYLLAGSALGGVLGALVVNRLSATRQLAPVLVGGMLLLALPFAISAAVTAPVIAAALQIASGAGMVIVDVVAVTALQRDLPQESLGRVLGVLEMVALGVGLVSGFAVAALLHATSLTTTLLVVGLGFSLLAVLGVVPLVRADRNAEDTAELIAGRVSVLETLDIFAGTSRSGLERLARSAEHVKKSPRSWIVREGADADALWVLLSGRVDVKARAGARRPRALHSMTGPAYFGDAGLLHGLPRTASVTAGTLSTLWRIPAEDFFDASQGSAYAPTALTRAAPWQAVTLPRPTRPIEGPDVTLPRPSTAPSESASESAPESASGSPSVDLTALESVKTGSADRS